MKFQLVKGETSVILTVFIQDSSSTTGAGLGSLIHTSSIVGGYLKRNGTGVALAVDEDVATEGTYAAPSTAAQVRIGTPANMTSGTYELHFHNDLFTTADWVTITLGGASNMAPLTIEVQLTDVDLNTATVTMRGTDSAALASVCTEGRLAELDAANLPSDMDDILADTGDMQPKMGSFTDLGSTAQTVAGNLADIAGTTWSRSSHSLSDRDTTADVVDATWNELKSGHTTAGSYGHLLGESVLYQGVIAGVTTPDTVFTITTPLPSTDPDSYVGMAILLQDVSATPDTKWMGKVSSYSEAGGTGTITLTGEAGFTLAASDLVTVFGTLATLTQTQIRDAMDLAGAPGTSIDSKLDTLATNLGSPSDLGSTNQTIADNLVDIAGSSFDHTNDALEDIKADLDIITGADGANLLSGTQTSIDAIETQIGTAGAGLTDLGGMSTGMKAEVNAEADTAQTDYGALKPTTGGRTLDVTATGAGAIDWANIENPTTSVDLSETSVKLCDTVTTVTTTTTNTDMVAAAPSVSDILTTQMTEAYAADGAAPTIAQALCMIQQLLGEFAISGTTLTMKKVDGSTTAATFTLDDATNPTSTTRAS